MKTLKERFTNVKINNKSLSQIFGGTGITDPELSGTDPGESGIVADITDPEIANAPRDSNHLPG